MKEGLLWSKEIDLASPDERAVCGTQGASSVSADFSTQVQRMKALGFNAVKLPFSFKTLLGTGAPPKVPLKCTTATAAQIQVPPQLCKTH